MNRDCAIGSIDMGSVTFPEPYGWLTGPAFAGSVDTEDKLDGTTLVTFMYENEFTTGHPPFVDGDIFSVSIIAPTATVLFAGSGSAMYRVEAERCEAQTCTSMELDL